MAEYKFKERRWIGSSHHNKYLRYIGILIILFGIGDKIFGDGGWSTIISGILVAVIGGYFPYAVVAILWLIGILYFFTRPPESSAAEAWGLGIFIVVISVIVALTSKHVGEEYTDVYVKEKKPWEQ